MKYLYLQRCSTMLVFVFDKWEEDDSFVYDPNSSVYLVDHAGREFAFPVMGISYIATSDNPIPIHPCNTNTRLIYYPDGRIVSE